MLQQCRPSIKLHFIGINFEPRQENPSLNPQQQQPVIATDGFAGEESRGGRLANEEPLRRRCQ